MKTNSRDIKFVGKRFLGLNLRRQKQKPAYANSQMDGINILHFQNQNNTQKSGIGAEVVTIAALENISIVPHL